MKYIVVETVEREISVIGSFYSHKKAKRAMAKSFYKFHKDVGKEDQILPEEELFFIADQEFDDWYFSSDGAWSNVDSSYNYDIKIIEKDNDRSDVLLYNAIIYMESLLADLEPDEFKKTMMNELGISQEEYDSIMGKEYSNVN